MITYSHINPSAYEHNQSQVHTAGSCDSTNSSNALSTTLGYKITKIKMENLNTTQKGYTQKEFIKKIAMVSIGIFIVSGIVSFGFSGLMEDGYAAKQKEREKIEFQLKEAKERASVKAKEIDIIAAEHEAKIEEFRAISKEVNDLRTEREKAVSEIDNWINEDFHLSQ